MSNNCGIGILETESVNISPSLEGSFLSSVIKIGFETFYKALKYRKIRLIQARPNILNKNGRRHL